MARLNKKNLDILILYGQGNDYSIRNFSVTLTQDTQPVYGRLKVETYHLQVTKEGNLFGDAVWRKPYTFRTRSSTLHEKELVMMNERVDGRGD